MIKYDELWSEPKCEEYLMKSDEIEWNIILKIWLNLKKVWRNLKWTIIGCKTHEIWSIQKSEENRMK